MPYPADLAALLSSTIELSDIVADGTRVRFMSRRPADPPETVRIVYTIPNMDAEHERVISYATLRQWNPEALIASMQAEVFGIINSLP